MCGTYEACFTHIRDLRPAGETPTGLFHGRLRMKRPGKRNRWGGWRRGFRRERIVVPFRRPRRHVYVLLLSIAGVAGLGFLLGLAYWTEPSIGDRLANLRSVVLSWLPEPEIVKGRVTHVRDGDTIEIGSVAIRIADLDCAERFTQKGQVATHVMRQLVSEKVLSCELEGRKSYDREVGTCYLPGGRDVAEVLIERDVCDRWW